MKHGVMAGSYNPLYPEVTLRLRDDVKSHSSRWVYTVLVSLFPVAEEWGDDPVWISGVILATKADIARKSGVSRGGFGRLWQPLLDAGLVQERGDGLFCVPFFKKIPYGEISAGEIRERLSRLEGIVAVNGWGPGAEERADSILTITGRGQG